MNTILKFILALVVMVASAAFVFELPPVVVPVKANRQERRAFAATRRSNAEGSVSLNKRRSWFAASELVYGFHDLENQKAMKITEIGITETFERIAQWQAEIERVYNAIFGQFTMRKEEWNTTPITRYRLPSASRMQFVDERGVAKPTREMGYQEIGLPLMRYEGSIGYTYEALQKVTVEEYSNELARIDRGDMNASIRLFLFAIFYNANWTFTNTEDKGPASIPVKAFANNDSDQYISRGEDDMVSANHYDFQSDAIGEDHDPFPEIKETLTGYAGTSPSDRIVTFVGDSTNATNIKALPAFHTMDRTQFTNWGDDVSLVDPSADTFIGMGDEVLGEHEDGVLVVRWKKLPANFLVNINLDAPVPVGIREDDTPSLRGLFNINAIENSGNSLLARFRRKIGMAPINRTAVSVVKIGAGSYSPPTGYDVIPG